MNLIDQNPFRVAGILASASARELEKQKSRIARFASVGKAIESPYDFSFLTAIVRTEAESNKAFALIEQNHGRVNQALFWFADNGPIDASALEYLTAGDVAKAKEIWHKVTDNKPVSENNFSYYNNLGTLLLSQDNTADMQAGTALKFALINSPIFKSFIALVADANYAIDGKKQIEQTVEQLMASLENHPSFEGTQFMNLFMNCPDEIKLAVSRKFTEDPLHNIDNRIEAAKSARKKDPKEAYNAGLELFKSTQPDVLALRSTLSSEATQFKLVADKLAKELLQCGIDYFKALNDTGNPAPKAIEIIRLAKEITRNEQVLDRINDNIEAIGEWGGGQPTEEERAKVGEDYNVITEAIDENVSASTGNLDAIVKFVKICRPRLGKIKEALGAENEFYIAISSTVTNIALNTVIDIVNREQGKLKHNHSHLNALAATVTRSVGILNALDPIAKNAPTKQRFNENKRTINSIKSQLNTAKNRKAGSDVGNVIRIIIGVVVLFIFIARSCN
ncbi:MAG: hypothetical protein GQ574_29000 [Crocinitomix sp.]|nr:hypothetical protein [Crocinitomix sp.]